jgi:hypothetical protein
MPARFATHRRVAIFSAASAAISRRLDHKRADTVLKLAFLRAIRVRCEQWDLELPI